MKNYSLSTFLLLFLFGIFSGNAFAAGLTTYYHDDHLGSPVYSSDDFGQVQWQQKYKPFGEKENTSTATAKNDIWFTGKPHDDDTGLTYMNARYYDPVIGRFMAVDPVGYVDTNSMSFNRYLYVNNNPYKYNDPDGEFLNFVVGGVWAAAQNIVIQNIEIAIGVRDQFSYGELAAETALGVVTSGASTIKNTGRMAATAVNYANKADNVGDLKTADNLVSSTGYPKGPISVDDALTLAGDFLKPGVPVRSIDGKTGVQFIQEYTENGQNIAKRVGFDLNPNNKHVQELGPHLNLQTQINGVIQKGKLADPHIPIDPTTIRSGDY